MQAVAIAPVHADLYRGAACGAVLLMPATIWGMTLPQRVHWLNVSPLPHGAIGMKQMQHKSRVFFSTTEPWVWHTGQTVPGAAGLICSRW